MTDRFPSSIVCPVDFSEPSASALRYAATFQKACGSRVTVVHAHSFAVPAYFTPGRADEIRRQYRDAFDDVQKALDQFVMGSSPALQGAVLIAAEGDPADLVESAARDAKADLVLLGTHGRSGFERMRLGSVAERLLRHSRLSTLTVRAASGEPGIRRIVCAVNDSELSRSALKTADELAVSLTATLAVLHVDEGRGERAIADLCAWLSADHPKCTVQEVRRTGHAAEEILKYVSDSQADLLVIGAEHRMFFDSTVLGATTTAVVRHAPCPVLTIKNDGARRDVEPTHH